LHSVQQLSFGLNAIRVQISVFEPGREQVLNAEVVDTLAEKYPVAKLECATAQQKEPGYYTGIRFGIYAQDQAATEYFLADGGFTDWTQQLLSDRRERLLISGIGSERLISCFGKSQ
jgi:hypothetical protein